MYFKSLQVLRGLAALAVVLYHLNYYVSALGGNSTGIFSHFDANYSHGAWFFFVLSGFLMAYLIDTGYRHFLPRRLLRIYPSFLVAAVGVLVLKTLLYNHRLRVPLPLKALSLLPFGTHPIYPLFVEWTLIYEVFFYLVCSIFANDWFRRLFPIFLWGWLATLLVCNLAFGAESWFGRHDSMILPSAGHIAISFMNTLFIAGGLAYYLYKRVAKMPAWHAAWLVPLSMIVYVAATSALAVKVFHASPSYVSFISQTVPHILLLSLSFALLLLAACIGERGLQPSGRLWRLLEKFGDHSYALYLLHVPVITILLVSFRGRTGHTATNLQACVCLAAALVAGWIFGIFDVGFHSRLKRWVK